MDEMRFHDPERAARAVAIRDRLVTEFKARYVWEDVACLMCGVGAPSSHALTKFGIDMLRCSRCGHLYVSPRLPEEAVPELYSSSYWDDYMRAIGSPTLEERVRFDYENGFGKLARDVLPHRNRGRLLDVGASNGGTVRAARDSGFLAEGIEPSREICDLAKRVNGVDLHCADVRYSGLGAGSYDVITMHDVLEHVFEPEAVLLECRRLLAPAGVLVAETPTTDSLTFVDKGEEWEYVSPLEHVHLFSEGNLARLVERCGFNLVDLYCPHENNQIVIAEVA